MRLVRNSVSSPKRNRLAYAAAALAGVVGGVLWASPQLATAGAESSDASKASSTSGSFRAPLASEVVDTPPYPVNDRGMSYGSGMGIDAKNTGPELIAAYGTNGTLGYIRAADRDQPAPAGPVTRNFSPQSTREIPLYAEDGVTVIGTFAITPGVANVIK